MANHREAGWEMSTVSGGGAAATLIKQAQTVPSSGKHIIDGVTVSFSGTTGQLLLVVQDCAAPSQASFASIPSTTSLPSLTSVPSLPSAPTVFQMYVAGVSGGEPVDVKFQRGIPMTTGGPVVVQCPAAASTSVTIALNVHGRTINT